MPRAAGTVEVECTTTALRDLYVRLGEVGEVELRRELRRSLTEMGGEFKQLVKDEASWSTRIPGAVKVKASFSKKGAGVVLEVDQKKAPEARVLEHGGRQGKIRHPVFADAEKPRGEWTWTDKEQARPFLGPAGEKFEAGPFELQGNLLMNRIARRAGFV